jgi:hypothetical protein
MFWFQLASGSAIGIRYDAQDLAGLSLSSQYLHAEEPLVFPLYHAGTPLRGLFPRIAVYRH